MRFFLSILLAALLLTTACATKSTTTESSQTPESQAYTATYKSTNFYYDFDDILVPRELEPVDDEKYVFDDLRFLAGFRIFEGRVVAEDVFNFFLNNMQRDGWVKKYSLKAEKSVIIFEKPHKSCTVQIEDGFQTRVTIFAIELKGDVSDAKILQQ